MKPMPASSMTMLAVTTRDGSTSRPAGRGGQREQRRDAAAGDLLVEERDPAPRHQQLEPVDADGGDERRSRPRSAFPPSSSATPAHITPQPDGDRPARRCCGPRRRCGPASVRASVEVDPVAEHVADEVVDQREVLVVDVALGDLADLDDRRLLAGRSGSSSTAR